jgi:gliding motility-associated-like protein
VPRIAQSRWVCRGDTLVVGTSQYTQAGVYQDTLTTQAGCDSIVTTTLEIREPSAGRLSAFGCNRLVINGQAFTQSGTYTQTLTNRAGCDSTLTLELEIFSFAPDFLRIVSLPARDFAPFALDSTYRFTTRNTDPSFQLQWFWQEQPVGNAPIYARTMTDTGRFELRVAVSAPNGCTGVGTREVVVDDFLRIYLPSAFSPNNDSRNDLFEVQGQVTDALELHIYNRWGQLIHTGQGANHGWDGTHNAQPAPEGVYTYRVFLRQPNRPARQTTGTFMLLR